MFQERDIEHLIAVTAEYPALEEKAFGIAQELELPFVSPCTKNYLYLLLLTLDGWVLKDVFSKKTKPVCVDFLSSKLQYRQKNNHRELLKKALGSLPPASSSLIVDATAGFGEDAFILANKGYRVLMLERSAILATLLKDGLNRLNQSFGASSPLSLELIHQDAKIYLPELARQTVINIIYLDPMFPERKKAALSRKEMEILRKVVGSDPDAVELLQISLKTAVNRVIVKRPRLAQSLGNIKPAFSISGKISRFDVYTTRT